MLITCTPLCFLLCSFFFFLFLNSYNKMFFFCDTTKDRKLMSLSHFCVILSFVYGVVVFSSRLSQSLSVVSVVQITLNSQVRNLIEVIRFTLRTICLSPSLSGSPSCLYRCRVLCTNTNLILCSSSPTSLHMHADHIIFHGMLLCQICFQRLLVFFFFFTTRVQRFGKFAH